MIDLPVQQLVNGWEDWPDDVVVRLRAWNEEYLLAFRIGPDFKCEGGCGRWIAANPGGDAVVRATKKTPGSVVCEDCLIAFARRCTQPPRIGLHGANHQLRQDLTAQRRRYEELEERVRRLRDQLKIDDLYVGRLEQLINPAQLQALKDEIRGQYRRRTQ